MSKRWRPTRLRPSEGGELFMPREGLSMLGPGEIATIDRTCAACGFHVCSCADEAGLTGCVVVRARVDPKTFALDVGRLRVEVKKAEARMRHDWGLAWF